MWLDKIEESVFETHILLKPLYFADKYRLNIQKKKKFLWKIKYKKKKITNSLKNSTLNRN